MSLRHSLALLLAVLCFVGRADDTGTCRLALSKLVLDKRSLDADDLRDFLEAPPGTNPVDFARGTAPELHGWRRLFERHASPRAERALREHARALLERIETESRKERDARNETRALVTPIVIGYLEPGQRPFGPPISFSHRGKRYVAFAAHVDGLPHLLVMDAETFELDPLPAETRPGVDGPVFARHRGRGYLAYLGPDGLETVGLDGGSADILPNDPVREKADFGPRYVEIASRPWLATVDPSTHSLALVPLGRREAVKRLFPGNTPGVPGLAIWPDAERPLFAIKQLEANRPEIAIGELGGGEPRLVDAGLAHSPSFHFFGLRGEPQLLVNGDDALYRIDPQTPVPVKLADGRPGYRKIFLERAGKPMAIVNFLSSHISLLDLETGAAQPIAPHPMSPESIAHFTFRGNDYLTVSQRRGTITIYDLAHPEHPSEARVFDDHVSAIFPFESNGSVMAVVFRGSWAEPAYLVQLAGPVPPRR